MKKIILLIMSCAMLAIMMPGAIAAEKTKEIYDMAGKDTLTVDVPEGDYKINILTGGDTETNANIYINGGERVRTYTLEAGEEQDNEQYAVPKDGKIVVEVKGDSPNVKTITIEEIPPREAGEHPTIYIAGDSTAQTYNYDTVYPQTGWGQVLADYFTDDIKVENRSMGGRSSKSFDNDGRLDKILTEIRPGDYLFIQFGINDGAENKPERYISVEDFKKLITDKYIGETKKRGAIPVLLTPTAASWWDEEKREFMESRQDYAVPIREIAEETGVTLVDINDIATDIYNFGGELGEWPEEEELSEDDLRHYNAFVDWWKNDILSLYFICEPLESAAYPAGTDDHTHLKEAGARFQAEFIAAIAMRQLDGLAKYALMNPSYNFTDIQGHWAERYIEVYAFSLGLKGRNSTSFDPDGKITRAEFLKLAMKACGIVGHAYREDERLDAASDSWYRFYLQGALDKDLIPVDMIENCTYEKTVKILAEATDETEAVTAEVNVYNGGFDADRPITREEMAVILYGCFMKAAGNKYSASEPVSGIFTDENEIADWAAEAVNSFNKLNILYGYEDGEFKPKNNLTRAEAVKAVVQVYKQLGYNMLLRSYI